MKKNIMLKGSLVIVFVLTLFIGSLNIHASSNSERAVLKDYAFLSMIVYDETLQKTTGNRSFEKEWVQMLKNCKPLTTKDREWFNRYKVLSHKYSYNTQKNIDVGVYSMLLKDITTGEYIVSFRGTETEEGQDMLDDGSLATRLKSLAFQQAEEHVASYLSIIEKETKSPTINFTGHSLGGALAQHSVVYAINKKSANPSKIGLYTFNGPTFSANIQENKTMKKLNTSKIKHLVLMDKKATSAVYKMDGIGSIGISGLLGSNTGNVYYVSKSTGGLYSKMEADKAKIKPIANFVLDFSLHDIESIFVSLSKK